MTAARWTKPRVVVRRNALESEYMQPSGDWGDYRTAKRFTSDAAADAFAATHGVTDHGLFNVSVRRRIRSLAK